MLANKLISAGYRNLRLNAMDLEYEELLKAHKGKQKGANGLVMLTEQNMPWPTGSDLAKLQRLIKRILKEAPLTEDEAEEWSDKEILEPLEDLAKLYDYHHLMRQIIQWFKHDPNNHIELVAYKNMNDYLDDCKKDVRNKSDILVAIDYYTDQNYPLWDKLRTTALKSDGMAYSVDELRFEDGTSSYFSSEGIGTSLKHFKWILFSRISGEEPKYTLLPVHEIPRYKILDDDGETTGKIGGPISEIIAPKPHKRPYPTTESVGTGQLKQKLQKIA